MNICCFFKRYCAVIIIPLLSAVCFCPADAQIVRSASGGEPIITVPYNSQELNENVLKIKQAMYVISNFFLDTSNMQKTAEQAITSFIQELDPHSAFISAKDVAEMEAPLVGNFNGIGIEYAIIKDSLSVQSVIPGGPSEKVGLRSGDKIISVGNEEISNTHLTQKRVIGYLRGERGTIVNIKVYRRGSDVLDFSIKRDKIPLNTVDASYEISPGIMYVRLSRFGAQSYNEVMKPLAEYKGKLTGLVLDLRGNPGGYLSAALKIANEFLGRGQLILYTEGRSFPRTDDIADGRGIYRALPLAVLIDESSASASEIVSGAIQDWDRGTIIGRRSFGKGLVQQEFPLQDDSRIRLTVARYHTPSGRVIQSPYEDGRSDKYYENVIKRYISDERFNKDSIKINDSVKFKTLKLGRTVYGGGGIIPDVFMPLDTSYYSKGYIKTANRGYLYDFVTAYTDNNRKKLTAEYKDFEDFEKRFVVSDNYYNEFLAYSKEHGVELSEKDLAVSGGEIKKNLKGMIVRTLYGLETYLRYDNETDPEVLKAVEVLKKK